MTKTIKAAAVAVLVLVVLLILTTVILNFFVSPEFMRHKISEVVSQKMHRQVQIKGRLAWSLFPRLKINVSQIELGNPEGFLPNTQPFAQVQQLNLGLDLFKLVRGKVEINYLALNGLQANLVVNKQGQANWDMGGPVKDSAHASVSADSTRATPLAFNIGSIFLGKSAISYEDLTKNQRYALSNLNVTASHIMPNNPFDFSIATDADLGDARTGQLSFSGEMLFDPQWKQVQLAHINSQNSINLPGMKPLDINFSGSLLADRDKKHLSITEFAGELDTAQITGEIETNYQNANAPVVLATLQIHQFDPRHLFAVLHQPMPAFQQADAMSRVSANLNLQATTNALQVTQLQVKVDDSTLTGNAAITDLAKKNFQFTLNLDQLNADKYQLQATANATPAPAASIGATQGAAQPTYLQKATGVGRVTIGAVNASGLIFKNISLNLLAGQGVFRLSPVKMQFEQGQYVGKFSYDSVASRFSSVGSFTGVQMQALTKVVSRFVTLNVSGNADLNETLTTQGHGITELTQNLNGSVLFVVKQGVLQGIDLPYYYNLGKSMLSKDSHSVTDTNQTPFGNLSGTFDIKQGIATNNDFLLLGPLGQAHGSGTADLVNQKLNFHLTVAANGANSVTVPLLISGPFNKITVVPDLQQVATDQIKIQAKHQLHGKVGEIIQKNLGKDAGTEVINQLNNLLQ